MDKPSLFIHVGAHKTGTTSIQQFFRSKGAKKRVFMFPQDYFDCLYSGSKSTNELEKNLERLKKQIVKDIKKTKRAQYLISNEELSGNIFSFYDNARGIAAGLHHVTENLFGSITVIIYVREQTQWLHSIYTQQIQQGESYKYEDFCKKITATSLDWNRLIEPYKDTFGSQNVLVKQYDKEKVKHSGGLVSDFVRGMGVTFDPTDACYQKEYNKSYSRAAIALALQVNQHLSQRQKGNFRRHIQRLEMNTVKVNFSFLTREQFIAEKNFYSELNQRSLTKHFEPNTELFETADNVFCLDEIDPITDKDLIALLAKIQFSTPTSDLVVFKFIAYFEESVRNLGKRFPFFGSLSARLVNKLSSWGS